MMQNAALLWHVSLLVPPEKKALALGLVGLVNVVPIVVFSMISGVVADAWDRRKLMLVTQLGAALVSVMLAVLTFRGLSVVWPIYLLAGLGRLPSRSMCPPDRHWCRCSCPASTCRTPLPYTSCFKRHGPGPARSGDCRFRCRLGIRGQCGFIRCVIAALLMMRDVPARQPSPDGSRRTCRFARRSKVYGSSSDRRRYDPRCCSISSRRFCQRPRCRPSSRRISSRSARRIRLAAAVAPAAGAVVTSAVMVPLTERIKRRRRCFGPLRGMVWRRRLGLSRSFLAPFAVPR